MTTAEEMAELVNLWGLVQTVQLQQHEDTIMWRWTSNGMYTAKSAYQIQFRGSF
jgi:hypothetical protein